MGGFGVRLKLDTLIHDHSGFMQISKYQNIQKTSKTFWPTYRTIWATTILRPGTPAKKRKKRNLEVFGFLPFHLNSDENGSFRRLLDWLSAVPVFFWVGPNKDWSARSEKSRVVFSRFGVVSGMR